MFIKQFTFSIDIKDINLKKIGNIVADDVNGNSLLITLIDNGKPFDITGLINITFTVLKPDGTYYIDSLGSRISVVDAEKGQISIVIGDNAISAIGFCKATVEIYGNGLRVTSSRFGFEVVGELSDGADITGDSEYPVLVNLIEQVNDVATGLPTKADKVVGATADHIATLDANGNIKDGGASLAEFAETNIGSHNISQTAHNDRFAEKADLVEGKVPSTQLPSYVDDVLEYADFASLPVTGETGKIYTTLDNNKTYRWGGSAYVEISPSLALGETSATAYRGDKGKTSYDHSQNLVPHVTDVQKAKLNEWQGRSVVTVSVEGSDLLNTHDIVLVSANEIFLPNPSTFTPFREFTIIPAITSIYVSSAYWFDTVIGSHSASIELNDYIYGNSPLDTITVFTDGSNWFIKSASNYNNLLFADKAKITQEQYQDNFNTDFFKLGSPHFSKVYDDANGTYTLQLNTTVCYTPTSIDFGLTTQQYDINGTTWVTSTDGTPNQAGHLLVDCLSAINVALDGNYLAVREASGATPLTVDFTFEDMGAFDTIKFRAYYVGSVSHNIEVQLYNYDTLTYDTFQTYSGESGYVIHSLEVLNSAPYISAETVKLRINHTGNGLNTHRLEIDYIALCDGGSAGGGGIPLASAIPFVPVGSISATNVQTAIQELDTEKIPLSSINAANGVVGTGADNRMDIEQLPLSTKVLIGELVGDGTSNYFTFSGLDILADGGIYELILVGPLVGAHLSIFFNGDTANTSYDCNASPDYSLIVSVCPTYGIAHITVMLAGANKKAVAWAHSTGQSTNSTTWLTTTHRTVVKKNTVENITQISVGGGAVSNFTSETKIILLKRGLYNYE